jgi:hypothetical protein
MPSQFSCRHTLGAPYDPQVLGMHPGDLDGHLAITASSRAAPPTLRRPVTAGGDLQCRTDRLDPELAPVGVEVTDHLADRPSSSAAKKADDLRISFARRNSRSSRSSLPQPSPLLARQPAPTATIDLSLAAPLTQRLGRHPRLGGDRRDRCHCESYSP